MRTLFIAVAAVVVLLIVAFVVWHRRVTAQRAAALESVARGIRELRLRASRPVPMHAVSEHAGRIPAEFPAITEDLRNEGFRILGDVEEHDFDGRLAGRLRWFTSADTRIYGWFGIAHGSPVMLLLSEDAGGGFVATIRSPHSPGPVVPSTVRELRIRWEEGLGEAIAGHRAALQTMSAPMGVADLDGALASLRRLKEHVGAWRARQDPETLLEADVRNIVGDQFDDLGPTLVALVQLLETIHAEMDGPVHA